MREEKEEEREEMVDMAEEDGGGRGRGQNSSVEQFDLSSLIHLELKMG